MKKECINHQLENFKVTVPALDCGDSYQITVSVCPTCKPKEHARIKEQSATSVWDLVNGETNAARPHSGHSELADEVGSNFDVSSCFDYGYEPKD